MKEVETALIDRLAYLLSITGYASLLSLSDAEREELRTTQDLRRKIEILERVEGGRKNDN